MNHINGWMNGGMNNSNWMWPVIGVLLIILLVVVISKIIRK